VNSVPQKKFTRSSPDPVKNTNLILRSTYSGAPLDRYFDAEVIAILAINNNGIHVKSTNK